MACIYCLSMSLLLAVVPALGEEHCLAQKQATVRKVMMRVSASKHSQNEVARADEEFVAEEARPSGPLLMNLTKMDEKALSKASRHVNGQTVTSDWFNEYPVAPPVMVVAANTTKENEAHRASSGVPLALAAVAAAAALRRC
uniref:Subtilisin n=1 Tax=Alexandrium monilatum TaxID=311494 RepID=A0A7S4UXX5_9DINO